MRPTIVWVVWILLLFLAMPAMALYEDQQGTFDWKKDFLGAAKFAAFPPGQSAASRVFVAAEGGVVASLSLRTGEIVWRVLLEELDAIVAQVRKRLWSEQSAD